MRIKVKRRKVDLVVLVVVVAAAVVCVYSFTAMLHLGCK